MIDHSGFLDMKNSWWGMSLLCEILAQIDPPFENAIFQSIFAHSASGVPSSEESSIITDRKSITGCSLRWTAYVVYKLCERGSRM